MAVKMAGKETEKQPVNRKLILWLFVITGGISGLLWWRGHPSQEREIKLINPVVETRIKPTQTKKPDLLRGMVEERLATVSGEYAISYYNLETKTGWGINENEVMEGASLMKIPAMLTALNKIKNGELTLEGKVILKEVDRSPGAGPLQYVTAGTEITIERILSEMGKKSDNTGWRMLNRTLGSESIEAEMTRIGMKNSEYVGYTTTAADIRRMFEEVYKTKEIHDFLKASIYEDRLAVGIPPKVELIHKVGTLEGVWEDAGIIKCQSTNDQCQMNDFILVILNKGIKRAEAEKFVPGLTNLIWDYLAEARN